MRLDAKRVFFPAVCLALAAVVAIAVTTPSAGQSESEEGLVVRILLFSGRPDPEFRIDAASEAFQLLGALPETAPPAEPPRSGTVIPAILGYKGILIRNPSGLTGIPGTVAVYRGQVEIDGGAESRRFFRDDNRALERSLLRHAVEEGVVDLELLKSEGLVQEEAESPEEEEAPPEG